MTILGTLNARSWDAGVPLTLGAEVATYEVDGDLRGVNVLAVPGVRSELAHLDDRVPLLYLEPEDAYQSFVLPCVTFKMTSMTPAFDRHPWYQWVARAPAKGAQKITLPDGTVGYDRYENQWRGTPMDLAYDLQVMARRRQEAHLILHYVLRRCLPPWFIFRVIDSLGDVREYDAGEISVSETSELADIADRTAAWTISFTVRAEIDLHDPVEMPAVQQVVSDVTYARYRPS
ncbi:MAG: hypothetical protein WC683_01725 [bacterium]